MKFIWKNWEELKLNELDLFRLDLVKRINGDWIIYTENIVNWLIQTKEEIWI